MVAQLAAGDSEAVMRSRRRWRRRRRRRRHKRLLPGGTWTIDLIGSFLLGVLIGSAEPLHVHPLLIAAAGTGFLGAYATFSTFGWETMRLVEEDAVLTAVGNAASSLIAGWCGRDRRRSPQHAALATPCS
jgi:protein CrcB